MALMDIIVNIAANTASLEQGMRRAESAVTNFAEVAKKVGEAFAVRELAEFVEHMIDAGDAMERAVQRSGASAEGFQKLAFAAKAVDVNADALATSMQRMERSLSLAGSGEKTQLEALNALGLSFKELKNLQPDEQFIRIGRAISDLRSPMDQARASQALFGRGFTELLPLFKETSAEFERMRDQAPIISEDQLENLAQAHKALVGLKETALTLAEVMVSSLAPGITAVADALSRAFSPNKKTQLEFTLENINKQLDHIDEINRQGGFRKWLQDLNAGTISGEGGLEKRRARVAADISTEDFASQMLGGTKSDIEAMQRQVASQLGATGPPGYAEKQEKPFDYAAGINEEMLKVNARVERELASETQRVNQQVDRDLEHRAKYEQQFFLKFFDELQGIAESGAAGMQQAFAEFFFDPIHKGFKGLLLDFVNVIRRMLAEAAAAKVMQVLFGGAFGAGGLSGILGGALGSVFGGVGTATGAAATSGGGGYGGGLGGAVAHYAGRGGALVYNIDARGADADRIMTVMPALLQQSSERTKRDLLDAFHRGGYAAPRGA